MLNKLMTAFAAFCVATVITQILLGSYMLGSGRVSSDTVTQIIALVNGIDISGDRLRKIFKQAEDREQPDFDEILEARKLDSFDMEMRLNTQQKFRSELSVMLDELKNERDRFDARLSTFQNELEEIREGTQQKGLMEVQRTLQSLDAAQAKELLLMMYDDERIDDVVTIIQAMPTEKRKDIMTEFTNPQESEKLYDILSRIADGGPTTALIDRMNDNL